MPRHVESLTSRPDGPLGPFGEQLAATHLTADGMEVVLRNWAVRSGPVRGELDVVALDPGAGAVVVVEVKARRSDSHGGPLLAVTPRKQSRIRSLTTALMREEELPRGRVRFDVVAVWAPRDGPGRLEHLMGAF